MLRKNDQAPALLNNSAPLLRPPAKKKIFKWLFLSLSAIAMTGAIAGFTLYNKPARNVEDATALPVTADQLVSRYEEDETSADQQFLDKVLDVSGVVAEITANQKGEKIIVLKGSDFGGVRCTIAAAQIPGLKAGTTIAIKGICTGYLTDVILVRCMLKK